MSDQLVAQSRQTVRNLLHVTSYGFSTFCTDASRLLDGTQISQASASYNATVILANLEEARANAAGLQKATLELMKINEPTLNSYKQFLAGEPGDYPKTWKKGQVPPRLKPLQKAQLR